MTSRSLAQRSPTARVFVCVIMNPCNGRSCARNRFEAPQKKIIFSEKCNYEASLYAVFSSSSYLSISGELDMKLFEHVARTGHSVLSLAQTQICALLGECCAAWDEAPPI